MGHWKWWREIFLGKALGMILLALSVLASLVQFLWNQKRLESPPGVVVLHLAHWQLESGYRDALESIIRRYEQLQGGRVKVIQVPITERLYGPWLNTHLISGDAPDLAEMGMARASADNQYVVRYFRPLSDLCELPNPHNRGTALEGRPWRETFLDGMKGGFNEQLQDYYSVPLCFLSFRWFYNQDLLKEATGREGGPASFAELMATCEAIEKLGARTGRKLHSLTSCKMIEGLTGDYLTAMTAQLAEKLDEDRNGYVDAQEVMEAFTQGTLGMHTPQIKAYYELLAKVAGHMPPGFTAMDRQQAQYLFLQGLSGFMATGSWDAEGIYRMAHFRVGVMRAPLPSSSEELGRWVAGKPAEIMDQGSGPFGIYALSRHPREAVDFLQFLTSQASNELFSRATNLAPIIVGARPSEKAGQFVADPAGYSMSVDMNIGGYVSTVFKGQCLRYLTGEIDYESFARQVEEALRDPRYGGKRQFASTYENAWRWCRQQERTLAVQAMRSVMDPNSDAMTRYRRTLLQQSLSLNGQLYRYRYEKLFGPQ